MYALYSTTGSQKWSIGMGGTATVNGSPTVSYDSIIYVGTSNSGILAIKDNGFKNVTILWRSLIGNIAVATTPTLTANNIVLFGSSNFKFYALNSKNGSFIWSYTTGIFLWY